MGAAMLISAKRKNKQCKLFCYWPSLPAILRQPISTRVPNVVMLTLSTCGFDRFAKVKDMPQVVEKASLRNKTEGLDVSCLINWLK